MLSLLKDILFPTLFIILVLCFPVSVSAMVRMIFKKSDARLVTLLAALLLTAQYVLGEKIVKELPSPSIVDDVPLLNMSLVNGLFDVFSILVLLMICLWISSLGVKLVDAIRQQNGIVCTGQKLQGRVKTMLCNIAVILLSLSFVYIVAIVLLTPLLHGLSLFPVLVRHSLLFMPVAILFCLVGFVISPAFLTTKRFHWMLALAVAGSLMQWIFNGYSFPESYTALRRLGTIIPPLLLPWFVFVGYAVRFFIPGDATEPKP